MLALGRRTDECLIIDLRGVDVSTLSETDKVIEIKVMDIRYGEKTPNVRLGFRAARQIGIYRKEVFRDIEACGLKHKPRNMGGALPQLLAIVQSLYDDLHSLPKLTPQGRDLLERVTAALKLAEPDKFDAEGA